MSNYEFEHHGLFGSTRIKQEPMWQGMEISKKPPEKCPVCEGRQYVPGDFYHGESTKSLTKCRSCNGKGYVR